jgi:hypothetical protein
MWRDWLVMVWSQDAAYMPAWGNHDWDINATLPDQLNNYEGRFFFPNSKTSPGASTAIGNGDDGNGDGSFPQRGVVHVTVGTGGRNLEQNGTCLWRE